MLVLAGLGSYPAVPSGTSARILRLCTPILVAARGYRARAMLELHAPDGAERLSQALDCFDRAREIVVRLDEAGSGGAVDPGAACWVGISGASGVMGREGSAHELPVKESLRSRARSASFGFLIFRPVQSGLKLYTLKPYT